MALLAFVIAKVNGAKRVKLSDFLIDWDRREPSEAQNADALRVILEGAISPASQP